MTMQLRSDNCFIHDFHTISAATNKAQILHPPSFIFFFNVLAFIQLVIVIAAVIVLVVVLLLFLLILLLLLLILFSLWYRLFLLSSLIGALVLPGLIFWSSCLIQLVFLLLGLIFLLQLVLVGCLLGDCHCFVFVVVLLLFISSFIAL
jgi:hypothetical protein